MDDVAIRVDNVSKEFKLPHEKVGSIKAAVVNFYRRDKSFEMQKALEDVSFEVKKGEFFGIVGRNGSGKSTLLKLLAGIYEPTKGTVHVEGSLTPFIELGVGFNQELTGRENVYLNGSLLGFSRKEMRLMYKDIVDFAELKRFMDQKLKNYSSGMQVRLAFSIAIRAKSDILLIDEVLAVGDAAFQRKCFNYFGELKKNKQTVIFVSHDMGSVMKYCDRTILINSGQLIGEGSTREVIPKYLNLLMKEEAKETGTKPANDELPLGMSAMTDIERETIRIENVETYNQTGVKAKRLSDKDSHFTVKFGLSVKKALKGVIPGVIVTNEQGEFIIAINSEWAGYAYNKPLKPGDKLSVEFKFPNILENGDYRISVNIVSSDFDTFYDWQNEVLNLRVDRKYTTGAKTNPMCVVRMSDGE